MKRKLPYLFFLVFIIGVILVLAVTFGGLAPSVYITGVWVALIAGVLWMGNALITRLLDRSLSWRKFGNIRFFLQLMAGVVFTLLVVNGAYFALKYLLTIDPPAPGQVIVMNAYGAVIFIPVYSIYFSLHFLRHWRDSETAAERYQKESIRSQLESLKNYLDPHFLFNNLNVLSSLIDKDKEKSKKFLDHFSEVYRAVLKTRTDDLIPLREELEFIQSYFFLIQVRFGEYISLTMSIAEASKSLRLPPLTLQMLVENAIKHNLITEKRPLNITISTSDDYLEVSNSLFPKPHDPARPKGSGHDNIKDRYQYFTDRPVVIEKRENSYLVRVPLIEITNA